MDNEWIKRQMEVERLKERVRESRRTKIENPISEIIIYTLKYGTEEGKLKAETIAQSKISDNEEFNTKKQKDEKIKETERLIGQANEFINETKRSAKANVISYPISSEAKTLLLYHRMFWDWVKKDKIEKLKEIVTNNPEFSWTEDAGRMMWMLIFDYEENEQQRPQNEQNEQKTTYWDNYK